MEFESNQVTNDLHIMSTLAKGQTAAIFGQIPHLILDERLIKVMHI